MAWFGQGKDTIEWEEFRDGVLFYKWPASEIKKGAKLIIRPGQHAVFFANGAIEGVFTDPGSFDVASQIEPFLSSLKGFFSLRSDTGMRAEVYFINAKQLVLPWGTAQRIMMPSPDVKSGIPIGMNGNLIVEFRDYLTFINKVAGVRSTYALDDIAERIIGELNPIIASCMLNGQRDLGLNALIGLQANSRELAKRIEAELDKELLDFGLGVSDFNIKSINYPKELAAMAEKMAAQSFVGDVGRYSTISMADSFDNPNGGNPAAAGAQMAMGMGMAQQMMANMNQQTATPAQPAAAAAGDRFCTKCRKMVPFKFCPDCGTETV